MIFATSDLHGYPLDAFLRRVANINVIAVENKYVELLLHAEHFICFQSLHLRAAVFEMDSITSAAVFQH